MNHIKKKRIAAFGGFRSIPPREGAAGSDKFAFELYPRIVKKGYELTVYSRIYPGENLPKQNMYAGVRQLFFKTVSKAGFDTLVHSLKSTLHIIFRNTCDVVHIHSGANSVWALPLRLAGKKVVVSQFAMDWKRDKWPWYGKIYYLISNYMTAYFPNKVVFDNIFTKEYFEKKFGRKYNFIPYGSEVSEPPENSKIFESLGVKKGEYFLFVGRFIPDKGVHLLIDAFRKLNTDKKLILVGGSPNPSQYEKDIKKTDEKRILFPGYIYGDDTNILMKNAFAYIQPSLIEGLSPVILTVMGLGTPLICSDIRENIFITNNNAVHFESNNSDSLAKSLQWVIDNYNLAIEKANIGKVEIGERFNWDKITNEFIEFFNN